MQRIVATFICDLGWASGDWDVSKSKGNDVLPRTVMVDISNGEIHHMIYKIWFRTTRMFIIFIHIFLHLPWFRTTCDAISFRFPAVGIVLPADIRKDQVCERCPTRQRAVYQSVQTGMQRKPLWDVVMEPFDTWCNKTRNDGKDGELIGNCWFLGLNVGEWQKEILMLVGV